MVAEALELLRAALPAGVELVAVSKFHPVERLMEAYNAGQRIFAESRPQELAVKVPQMPSDVMWHFIGHLQTNKLKLVLPYVDLVQSVDSLHLLEAINAWGAANGRIINVLLELHLGAEETKQGFSAQEILALLGAEGAVSPTVASRPLPDAAQSATLGPSRSGRFSSPLLSPEGDICPTGAGRGWPGVFDTAPSALRNVRICGLMGMATNTDDMEVVERDFERIERLFLQIKEMGIPGFDQLSIGMSGDWPVAVRHHATMVRIGTDIFGPREY